MARKRRLIGRKRGVEPRRTQRDYMLGLQREREALCRKFDRKSYDAFVPGRTA